MTSRKRTADINGGENRAHKRRNQPNSRSSKSTPTTDPNYGQRSVFGDAECFTTVPTGDSDLDCEDDAEALAYLKSYRTQASAIPHVIVATKAGPPLPPQALPAQEGEDEEHIDRSIYKNGTGDFRGYYHDGAYTAYPPGPEQDYDDESSVESSEDRPHNSNVDEIRNAYFTSLTTKFLSLRQLLQTEPPAELLSILPTSNPAEVGGFGRNKDTFNKWSGRLRGTDPLPAQIAGMHKDSVLRLLRIILGGKFLRKNHALRERTSRWLWALLARLPERGELDYQEIGWIRELGKRAVLMMLSLAEMEVLKEHYEVGDSSAGSLGEPEMDDDEGIDDESNPEESYDSDDNEADATVNGTEAKEANKAPREAPEETSDVEMQIDSDLEEEDGEVSEAPQPPEDATTDIETAKARLLGTLDATEEEEESDGPFELIVSTDADEVAAAEAAQRVKLNELVTLNMILTVAGEFYGQRDLLEFRDPFGGLQLDVD
ncbi:hypothetical protein M426DRAFT_66748 [Hypoxylon sp. CI-4A]|nr:hypothetical protein M426DRAFT_66748 [Hypoxylon sp. CI-4A]